MPYSCYFLYREVLTSFLHQLEFPIFSFSSPSWQRKKNRYLVILIGKQKLSLCFGVKTIQVLHVVHSKPLIGRLSFVQFCIAIDVISMSLLLEKHYSHVSLIFHSNEILKFTSMYTNTCAFCENLYTNFYVLFGLMNEYF